MPPYTRPFPCWRSSLAAGVVAWHAWWFVLFLWCCFAVAEPLVDDVTSTIPDVRACCRRRGVSEFCVEKLCNIREPPNEFDVFDVTTDCPRSLKDVAECLADGRDHSNCCKSKSRGIEDSCLHLCAGAPTRLNVTQWDDYRAYVACLSFNVQSMYSCMLKGYNDIPGPPTNVSVVVSGSSLAVVSWNQPEKLASKVRRYQVSYTDTTDEGSTSSVTMKQETTESTILELKNLIPDTRYVVYVQSSNDYDNTSVKSEPKYFTTGGVAPRVDPYEPDINSPLDVSRTLVCKIFITGFKRRTPSVIWLRKRESTDSAFLPLTDTPDYNQTIYQSSLIDNNKRVLYVATLTVKKVNSADFGVYRCVVRNIFGESSTDIRLRKLNSLRIPTAPPNVTECCIREGVQPLCLSACRSDVQNPANASLFESVLYCAADIPKVTQCAMEQKNYAACCLRQQVPFRCLPVCDGSLRPSLATKLNCAEFTSAIFVCLLEDKSTVPFPPSNIRLKSVQNGKATVEWNSVAGAEVYHIYYRRPSDSAWQRVTVGNNAAVLTNLVNNNSYHVQVLSANAAGTSDGSRLLKFQTSNSRRDQSSYRRDKRQKRKRRNGRRGTTTTELSSSSR